MKNKKENNNFINNDESINIRYPNPQQPGQNSSSLFFSVQICKTKLTSSQFPVDHLHQKSFILTALFTPKGQKNQKATNFYRTRQKYESKRINDKRGNTAVRFTRLLVFTQSLAD